MSLSSGEDGEGAQSCGPAGSGTGSRSWGHSFPPGASGLLICETWSRELGRGPVTGRARVGTPQPQLQASLRPEGQAVLSGTPLVDPLGSGHPSALLHTEEFLEITWRILRVLEAIVLKLRLRGSERLAHQRGSQLLPVQCLSTVQVVVLVPGRGHCVHVAPGL